MREEKSLFVELFGNRPVIRTLDFLLENDAFDYPKKDIARHSDVSWNTLETFWAGLEESGVVVCTRKVGKASMYKINSGNHVVKKLLELDRELVKSSIGKITAPAERKARLRALA